MHRRYNPEVETRLNIVPGLMGTILTLTMLIFTALSVTREIERGTMESLLSMPIRPVEIMLGKIAPYVVVGGLQMAIILDRGAASLRGADRRQPAASDRADVLFILANLSVGYTFSTHRHEPASGDADVVLLLPAEHSFVRLHVPVPRHARLGADVRRDLPLTHYLRIVRGIMLKGATFADLQTDVLAMAAFTLVAMAVAVARFRQTLD